jgi:hypothetical protein
VVAATLHAMSDVADILRAAADVLEPEGAWTRRAMARDRRGEPVLSGSLSACRWCAQGAIRAVVRVPPFDPCWQAERRLRDYLGVESVLDWNDAQPSVEPVLAALRAAAEKAP